MEREHTVNMSVTNGAECICNPEILLGTNYGLWNFEKEIAPRGTLLDLNAAWELFLSKQDFDNDVSFKEDYYHQHTVVDITDKDGNVIGQEVFEDGDTKYTLMDGDNETNATFVIKANKGPVEHIEWEQGNLILYYTKTRPVQSADINSGVPLHYVYDSDGNVVIDSKTGNPLIYDYVKIPVIEIFDNDETHKLFPWFADNQHTVRLRQTLDDPEDQNAGHLGDLAITSESELFVAKERYTPNSGNTLVSLQSLFDQLKQDLGIAPTYETVNDLVDSEGASVHKRANGSTLSSVLTTENTTSIADAINELVEGDSKYHQLIDGEDSKLPANIAQHLAFSNYILDNVSEWNNNIYNIVDALNWITDNNLGPFLTALSEGIITSNQEKTVTQALNNIYSLVIANRNRIGYVNGAYAVLNTDANDTLTNAINEVDQHTNALASEVGIREQKNSSNETYYDNPNLNDITKGRLRFGQTNKNNTTIIEDINELQAQIGNLNSSTSGVASPLPLTTDNKSTLVQAINEVDLHADNNSSIIGATYSTNVDGQFVSPITNLTTDNKSNIVSAINELDSQLGDLSNLTTDSQTSIVDAINEVIAEQPIVYQDTTDSNSGVKLKDQNNISGKKSLVVGEKNQAKTHSFVSGSENTANGNYTLISGYKNTTTNTNVTVFGDENTVSGQFNLVNGKDNTVSGNNNLVHGQSNTLISSEQSVVLGKNNTINCEEVTAIGSDIEVTENSVNAIGLGQNIQLKGSNTIALGKNNQLGENSVTLGQSNNVATGDLALGKNNLITSSNSYTLGNNNSLITGTNNVVLGQYNSTTGNTNYILGKDQTVVGEKNIVISNKEQSIEKNNAIVIGNPLKVNNSSTNIGGDIYIDTHDTQNKLQDITFVDLNNWCADNNAVSLNGTKFLDTSHVVQALKVYLTKTYTDKALLRFKMQDENENGYILVQGNTCRVYLKGSWFFTDDIENGWSRQDGTYLKVVRKTVVTQEGDRVTKYYLAFMDQLSTDAEVDTVGAQRSNTEDFGTIDLTHAFGAVAMDDIDEALDLENRFNTKVDKTAKIITKYRNSNGVLTDKVQDFVDPNNANVSADITLDLEDSFGVSIGDYQLKSEKGQAGGYVPLNASGTVDAQYLPSYVDDVQDVWAEYQVDSLTGAVVDVHLYELETHTVPTTGEEYVVRGSEILEGEGGKIYVEAQPSQKTFSTQFRWTGTRFIAIGFSNIVIGSVAGTAFDAARGVALEEGLEDHIKSGTTTIPVMNESTGLQEVDENGNPIYVVYKPNPHNVTAQQLPVVVDDPASDDNINADEHFIREYNVLTAIQELFDRLGAKEAITNDLISIIGDPQDIIDLDDDTTDDQVPTIISVLLETKEKVDNIEIITNEEIDESVNTYFDLTPIPVIA